MTSPRRTASWTGAAWLLATLAGSPACWGQKLELVAAQPSISAVSDHIAVTFSSKRVVVYNDDGTVALELTREKRGTQLEELLVTMIVRAAFSQWELKDWRDHQWELGK